MPKYTVTITRLMPQSTTFEVNAFDEKQARELALNNCGDHIFEQSGDAYDEEVESCKPIQWWVITCKQLVDTPSDVDDQEEFDLGKDGENTWWCQAADEDDALDQYHNQQAIGCLDDYEITATQKEKPDEN